MCARRAHPSFNHFISNPNNPDYNSIHTNYNNHFKDNNLTAILKPVLAGLVQMKISFQNNQCFLQLSKVQQLLGIGMHNRRAFAEADNEVEMFTKQKIDLYFTVTGKKLSFEKQYDQENATQVCMVTVSFFFK